MQTPAFATLLLAGVLAGCPGTSSSEAAPTKPLSAPRSTVEVSAVPPAVETATAAEPAPVSAAGPKLHRVVATVQSSLEGAFVAATDAELGPKLAQVSKRVLVWWVDVRRELQKGDSVEVIFETPDGEEPLVHAVWFKGQKYKSKELGAVRFLAEGASFARFVDADGIEIEKRLFNGPLRSYEQISSLVNDGRRHRGVDFKAPVGTKIRAPFDAVVSRRNWSTRGNGYCLELKVRGKNVLAKLLHLSSISKGLRPGVRIKKGQVVARSGNTGRSFAPHLHYQLERVDGRVLDPFKWHETFRQKLRPEHHAAVRETFARFNALRTESSW